MCWSKAELAMETGLFDEVRVLLTLPRLASIESEIAKMTPNTQPLTMPIRTLYSTRAAPSVSRRKRLIDIAVPLGCRERLSKFI